MTSTETFRHGGGSLCLNGNDPRRGVDSLNCRGTARNQRTAPHRDKSGLYFCKTPGGFKTDRARSLHEVQTFAIVHKKAAWTRAVLASAILGFVDVASSFV